jgi:hypothetical protein
VANGIVRNRMTLKRRIEKDGFPPGRLTGPNERTWNEAEIDAWYASRPSQGAPLRGAAKEKHARKRANSTDATTTA